MPSPAEIHRLTTVDVRNQGGLPVSLTGSDQNEKGNQKHSEFYLHDYLRLPNVINSPPLIHIESHSLISLATAGSWRTHWMASPFISRCWRVAWLTTRQHQNVDFRMCGAPGNPRLPRTRRVSESESQSELNVSMDRLRWRPKIFRSATSFRNCPAKPAAELLTRQYHAVVGLQEISFEHSREFFGPHGFADVVIHTRRDRLLAVSRQGMSGHRHDGCVPISSRTKYVKSPTFLT